MELCWSVCSFSTELSSFYRYVLEPELAFQLDGSYAPGPLATFSDLPHSPLLTLHMDVPHSWLVESLRSPHDLDNIHLEDVESRVEAEFQLEHILVEGTCRASKVLLKSGWRGKSSPTPPP